MSSVFEPRSSVSICQNTRDKDNKRIKRQQHEDNNKVLLIVRREEIYEQEKDLVDQKSIINLAEIWF